MFLALLFTIIASFSQASDIGKARLVALQALNRGTEIKALSQLNQRVPAKVHPLQQIGKLDLKNAKYGELAGPATGVAANVTVKAVGYGVPIAAAGVVAAVVPGGTAIVATTLNLCNASGVTAGYIAAVQAASRVAGLIGLMSPTP